MKKLIAIILTFALLIPLCVTAQADEVEKKPFYTVNWDGFDKAYSNIYNMPYFYSGPYMTHLGLPFVTWGGADIVKLAQKAKDYFDTVPEGARFINFNLPHSAYHYLNVEPASWKKPFL